MKKIGHLLIVIGGMIIFIIVLLAFAYFLPTNSEDDISPPPSHYPSLNGTEAFWKKPFTIDLKDYNGSINLSYPINLKIMEERIGRPLENISGHFYLPTLTLVDNVNTTGWLTFHLNFTVPKEKYILGIKSNGDTIESIEVWFEIIDSKNP